MSSPWTYRASFALLLVLLAVTPGAEARSVIRGASGRALKKGKGNTTSADGISKGKKSKKGGSKDDVEVCAFDEDLNDEISILFTTPRANVSSFLDRSGRAIAEIRPFIELIRSTQDGTDEEDLIETISDRELLLTAMAPDSILATDDNGPLVPFDSPIFDAARALQSFDCEDFAEVFAARALDLIVETYDLAFAIVGIGGPFGALGGAIGRNIGRQILSGPNGRAFARRLLSIVSSRNVRGFGELVSSTIAEVGLNGVLDAVGQASSNPWNLALFGVGLAANVVATFASGGAVLAAKAVNFGLALNDLYGAFDAISDLADACPPTAMPTPGPTIGPTPGPTPGPSPAPTPGPTPAPTPGPTPGGPTPEPSTRAPSPPTPAPVPTHRPPTGNNRGTSDPHFRTWLGGFSYQGACDLVYSRTDLATLHIRTAFSNSNRQFSFISNAAVSIGGDVLEVLSNRTYFVNGVTPTSPPADIGGFPLSVGTAFVITLPLGQSIRISFYAGTITLGMTGNRETFGNSTGISGAFDEDGVLGRDGTILPRNVTLYANEWNVNASLGDEELFVQPPDHEGCIEPETFSFTSQQQRDAEAACASLPNDEMQRDNCIFDVLATGRTIWANNPGFTEPLDQVPDCPNGDLCQIGVFRDGECTFSPLFCEGFGEICDPIDGQCKSFNDLVPCIAVIDEASNDPDSYFTNQWDTFRERYPSRPFCLLQPQATESGLFRPQAFNDDPLTRYSLVNRDNGSGPASDWFIICDIANLIPVDAPYVALFVDNSGSMTTATVRNSYDKFLQDLASFELTFETVENNDEDWILPFLVDFG